MRTSLIIGSRVSMALLSLGCAFVLGACGSAGVETETGDNGDVERVGASQEALSSGWTAWTSEEYPPISCDNGSVMTAFQCSGNNCDNIRAYCEPTGFVGIDHGWQPYFSEEGSGSSFCPGSTFINGIACNGQYCDSMSVHCTELSGSIATNYHWTGWFSEEGTGTLTFPSGYMAQGAACSGSFCDNLSFYIAKR